MLHNVGHYGMMPADARENRIFAILRLLGTEHPVSGVAQSRHDVTVII
jgi:hypothetical protein